jgi:hypothetical protein
MHDAHEGQGRIVDCGAGDACGQDRRAFGPADRGVPAHSSVTEVTCTRRSGQMHVEEIFQMLHHLAGVGRCRGHQELVLAEPPCGAVIIRQGRPRAASGRSAPCRRAGSKTCWCRRGRGMQLHRGLERRSCQGRDIDNAGALARRPGFAHIGLLDRLAMAAVDHRTVPEAGAYIVAPLARCQSCIGVNRSWPQIAIALRRQRTDRHRRKRRPEARRADLGNGLPSASAMMARPGTLDVLPWSVAMPSVV